MQNESMTDPEQVQRIVTAINEAGARWPRRSTRRDRMIAKAWESLVVMIYPIIDVLRDWVVSAWEWTVATIRPYEKLLILASLAILLAMIHPILLMIVACIYLLWDFMNPGQAS